MDKEAIKKVAKLLCRCGDDPLLSKPPERHILADRIIHTMKQLGYRKPPKDKPPLLSDEEVRGTSPTGTWYVGCLQCALRIAQAQRKADTKHYEEVSNNIS